MSTKTSIKRIALIAVSALGFGLVIAVAPASATAATGTVSPVRVTFTTTGGTTTQDAVPIPQISWTTAAQLVATDTVVLALTSAPSAAAKMRLYNDVDLIGTDSGSTPLSGAATTAGHDSLGATGVALAIDDWLVDEASVTTLAASGTARLGFMVDTAGSYAGTITVYKNDGTLVNTVSFSFTTRGVPSTVTLTSDATETSPGGTANLTITIRDAAGNVTQPQSVDTVAIADDNSVQVGTFSPVSPIAATGAGGTAGSLFDGTAAVTFTNTNVVGSVHNLTSTPRGTMGTLSTSTVTVTVNSTTIATTGITALRVSTPADAATVSGTTSATQDVRTGTSAITVTITGTASSTYRFALYASAGTVNGLSSRSTAPQYVTATTNSLGSATVSYTLAGAALLRNATSTLQAVNVTGGSITGTITVTQTDAAVSATSNSITPSGAIVRALGSSTSVTVSVLDQYGESLGAGYVIRAYRGGTASGSPATLSGGTLLSTATTNAAGEAVLTVTNASTTVNNGSETYNFTFTTPGVAGEFAMTGSALQVAATYTTTGNIQGMSTAISGHSGITLATVLDTSTTAAQLVIPAVRVPTDGRASLTGGTGIYTKSSGAVTAGATEAEQIALVTTNTPGNSTTYTTSSGAFVCETTGTSGCLWSAGSTSLEISAGGTVYAFATKTGLHTITATSGGKTTTIQFWAYNLETDYYALTAAADKTTLVAGSNGVVTIDVKDIFGNIVDTAGSLLTATAEGRIRLAGQALTQDMGTTSTGSFSFTVIADATAGTGTLTIAPGTRAQAWGASYVKPTGAADPVRSVTLNFTVTAATAKTTDDAVAAAEKAGADATAAANAAKAAADAAAAAAKAAETAAVAAAAKAEAEAKAATAAAQKAAADAVAAAKAAEAAAVAKAEEATDASLEAIDAANAATDAANLAAEAADAATVAAEEARDAADAATAAVEALASEISSLISGLRAQITTLANTVAKIAKKVRA